MIVRNTIWDNLYGEGKQQEVVDDTGTQIYIIKNTMWDNLYGTGKQKEMINQQTGERYVIRNTVWDNLYGEGKQQEVVNTKTGKRYTVSNSVWDDLYIHGGKPKGKQKEIVDEQTGKRYTLRNTAWDNLYGEGKQQEIIEEGGSDCYRLMSPEEMKTKDANVKAFIRYLAVIVLGAILFMTASDECTIVWWLLAIFTGGLLIYNMITNVPMIRWLIGFILLLVIGYGACIGIGYLAMAL